MTNTKENDEQTKYSNLFSCYPKGYRNKKGEAVLATKPTGVMTITQLADYIKSDKAKWATETLHQLIAQRENPDEPTKEENEREQEFKKLNFEIVTVGGIFDYRNASGNKERSIFRAIDIDDLESTAEARRIRELVIKDKFLKSAACFLSPRYKGVKNIVEVPEMWRDLPVKSVFALMTQHYQFHYGIFIDQSGSDISRATYIDYDPDCYINPDYINTNTNNSNED